MKCEDDPKCQMDPTNENISVEEKQLHRLQLELNSSERCRDGDATLPEDELRRWLRSCDNNVKLTAACVCRHLEFRRKRGLDKLLCDYTPPDSLCRNYPGGVCGVDKDGSPVSYEFLGSLDIPALLMGHTMEEIIHYKLWQFELIKTEIKRKSEARRSPVDSFLLIIDLTDLQLCHFLPTTLSFWTQMLHIMSTHYPGMVKEVLIINSNNLFPDFYLSLRPYIERKLRDKITVLGANFLKHLLLRIDKHELPFYLGGYRCDANGEEMCLTRMNWTNQIPRFPVRKISSGQQVNVLGGCRVVLERCVVVPNSLLAWNMDKISHQFTLTVYINTLDDPQSRVLNTRISSSSGSRNNRLSCPHPARYFVVIDNVNNMAAKLELNLELGIEVPDELKLKNECKSSSGDSVDFTDMKSEREWTMERERELTNPHFHWLEPHPPRDKKRERSKVSSQQVSSHHGSSFTSMIDAPSPSS